MLKKRLGSIYRCGGQTEEDMENRVGFDIEAIKEIREAYERGMKTRAERVDVAMCVQDELKQQLESENLGIADIFLDADAKLHRKEETELDIICNNMFLCKQELEDVIDKGKGEIGKKIISKIVAMTDVLAEKSKISFGEKRYMQGLLDGLLEYGERKKELDETEIVLTGILHEVKMYVLEAKEAQEHTRSLMLSMQNNILRTAADNNTILAPADRLERSDLMHYAVECRVAELEKEKKDEEDDEKGNIHKATTGPAMAMYKAVLEQTDI